MKRLYKDRWNRKIFGIFGSLGQLLHIDPNILRIFAIILSIPLGVVILPLAYFILARYLPEGPRGFIQPTYKRLYKNPRLKVMSGVMSGLADYLQVDCTLLRISALILCFATGFFPLFLTYIIAAALLPSKP